MASEVFADYFKIIDELEGSAFDNQALLVDLNGNDWHAINYRLAMVLMVKYL